MGNRAGGAVGIAAALAVAGWLLGAGCAGEERSGEGRRSRREGKAYAAIVAGADGERAALAAEWRAAATQAEEERVLDRAAGALRRLLVERILPAWNGTPWSFSGTAVAPGERPIACGYFVATALEHAGLRVERRSLARQAAEDIILSLVPADRIVRFRRAPMQEFLATVSGLGDGVYLVGLDYHVGFLLVEGRRVEFHHSSNAAGEVVREPALWSSALTTSSYRVVGKLFDRSLARAWLAGDLVPTRMRGAMAR
jgi:hypothetical protein